MKKSLSIIVVMTLLAILDDGVVLSGQKQPPNFGEVRKKIKPADEIWSEYQKLKYDMTPAGRAEQKRKAAEEAERLRKEAEAKAERDRRLAAFREEQAVLEAKRQLDAAKEELKQYNQSRYNETQEEYKRIKDEIPASDEAKQLYEYTQRKINEIRAEYGKAKAENITVDEVKQIRVNVQRKYDEIQVEYDKIREKIAAAEEARLAEQRRIEEERIAEAARKAAEPVSLYDAIRKSGLDPHDYGVHITTLVRFVTFGSQALQEDLQEAVNNLEKTVLNREVAQAKVDAVKRKIDAKREEIAQKTFFCSYTYSVDNVVDNGNESSFTMQISLESFHLTLADTIAEKTVRECVLPLPGIAVSKAVVKEMSIFVGWTISLRISGRAESLNELVSNKDNYRVHIWFNNLRCSNSAEYDMWRRNNALADVQKIEIVKIR